MFVLLREGVTSAPQPKTDRRRRRERQDSSTHLSLFASDSRPLIRNARGSNAFGWARAASPACATLAVCARAGAMNRQPNPRPAPGHRASGLSDPDLSPYRLLPPTGRPRRHHTKVRSSHSCPTSSSATPPGRSPRFSASWSFGISRTSAAGASRASTTKRLLQGSPFANRGGVDPGRPLVCRRADRPSSRSGEPALRWAGTPVSCGGGAARPNTPIQLLRRAYRTAWVRPLTASLRRMLVTWFLTVCSPIESVAATSLFVIPRAIASRISDLRGDSGANAVEARS